MEGGDGFQQFSDDPLGGVAVPERWGLTEAFGAGEEGGDVVAKGGDGGEAVAAEFDVIGRSVLGRRVRQGVRLCRLVIRCCGEKEFSGGLARHIRLCLAETRADRATVTLEEGAESGQGWPRASGRSFGMTRGGTPRERPGAGRPSHYLLSPIPYPLSPIPYPLSPIPYLPSSIFHLLSPIHDPRSTITRWWWLGRGGGRR
jgi:hypothetical protein